MAPAAAHAAAQAALKAQQARVPRGCLLRRVPAELGAGGGFAAALEQAGFRGDRLSVWVLQVGALGSFAELAHLRRRVPGGYERAAPQAQASAPLSPLSPSASRRQGLGCLGLGGPQLSALLSDLCDLAAFDSLVTGLLPPMDRRGLDNLLASFGCGTRRRWGRWNAVGALAPLQANA